MGRDRKGAYGGGGERKRARVWALSLTVGVCVGLRERDGREDRT